MTSPCTLAVDTRAWPRRAFEPAARLHEPTACFETTESHGRNGQRIAGGRDDCVEIEGLGTEALEKYAVGGQHLITRSAR